MSLVGFQARNHRQQVGRRGANPVVDNRATTPEVFAELHERFDFTIDVAASAENAKLPRFFSEQEDGLAQSWSGERVFCNPPYSNIEPWLIKAWESDADLVVMLLPANRTEQKFWQLWVEPFRDGRGTQPGELYVPLSNSPRRLLIDEADAAAVLAHRWRIDETGYAVTSLPRVEGKKRNQLLHRMLCGLERGDGLQADHINRDRLDNRRANLRVAKASENGRNRSLYANNSSGYKGVSFDKKAGKWEASIKVDYRKKFLGYFDTPEEAATAYDEAARRVHGLFASPNSTATQAPIRMTVEFLKGRMRFINLGEDSVKPNARPPFGCCLVIFEPNTYRCPDLLTTTPKETN